MDLADVLVAQPGAVMDGHLLLAVAAGPVARRRVWRDNGVESVRWEVGDVAYLPRRRLREPVGDEVLLAKQEQAVPRFKPLNAGATEQVAHLLVLFQQTHQVLPVWSVVRSGGGHQQLH